MGLLDAFHFIRPWWLLALLPLTYVWWRLYKNTSVASRWEDAVDPELLGHLLVGNTNKNSTLLYLVIAISWMLCVFALAGPSWERRELPTYRNVEERVLVIDLSRSMTVQDVKPSRLGRVRQKLEDILNKYGDSDNAVVVYAATPFVVAPLTNDVATIESMLPSLSIDIMPAQGSRTGIALAKAFELLQSVKSKRGSILLFTDSPVSDDAMTVATTIAEEGVSLSVIGVGSAEGAPIPHPRGGFIKDGSGNIVVAGLDEAGLRDLARAGGGQYRLIASDESDIDDLLKPFRVIDEGGTVDNDSMQQIEAWLDRGPWFIVFLLPVVAMLFRRGWL